MRICKDCGSIFTPKDERQYRCDQHEPGHRQGTNRRAYQRRRALGLRAGSSGAHRRFVREVLKVKGRVCHWCGGKATTGDHYPIAKKDGGPDSVDNGVPSCESCNLKPVREREALRKARV